MNLKSLISNYLVEGVYIWENPEETLDKTYNLFRFNIHVKRRFLPDIYVNFNTPRDAIMYVLDYPIGKVHFRTDKGMGVLERIIRNKK